MPVRRLLLTAVLAAACGLSPVLAAPQIQGNRVAVAAPDVQGYLDGNFPRTEQALGGLLSLTISEPKVDLPPGNRMALAFDLAMATLGGAPVPVGNVQLTSGLRYDANTQGFHLEQPSIDGFRPATPGAQLDPRARGLLNAWLADYARQEPVYRIDPTLGQLLGALQVRSAGVENGKVVLEFNQDLDKLGPAYLLGE